MQESDAIARLQRGDIGGLEALVVRYQEPALQAATLITRDYALAEDIVQAAFLRAYERIHQFDARRPFGPWFLRSVVNDALMAVTRHPHHTLTQAAEEDLLQQAGAEPGLEARLEAAETREAIRAALDQLRRGSGRPLSCATTWTRPTLRWRGRWIARRAPFRRRLHDARLRALLRPGPARPLEGNLS